MTPGYSRRAAEYMADGNDLRDQFDERVLQLAEPRLAERLLVDARFTARHQGILDAARHSPGVANGSSRNDVNAVEELHIIKSPSRRRAHRYAGACIQMLEVVLVADQQWKTFCLYDVR